MACWIDYKDVHYETPLTLSYISVRLCLVVALRCVFMILFSAWLQLDCPTVYKFSRILCDSRFHWQLGVTVTRLWNTVAYLSNVTHKWYEMSHQWMGHVPCSCCICCFLASKSIHHFRHWPKLTKTVATDSAIYQSLFAFISRGPSYELYLRRYGSGPTAYSTNLRD
jgi:hypothetical protein